MPTNAQYKPHPITTPLNAEDIDYNFDLLYRFVKDIVRFVGSVLSADKGGTGFGSYLVGDMLVADTPTSLDRLNAVASGNALISQGDQTMPVWGKIEIVGSGAHLNGFTQAGDLLTFDGTDYQKLTTGSDGQVLKSSGGATLGLEWRDPLEDGDYGDISVASMVLTIDAGVVSNSKLTDMPPWTVKMRSTSSTGSPQDVLISALTEEASPAAGDWLLGENSSGSLVKVDVGNISGGGVSDGDKGDITVSGSGTVWTIDAGVVSNSKLAAMAQNTIKLRNTAGSGDPEDVAVSSLTEEASPASGDWLLMEEAGGNLRKVDWANLPGAGAGEANDGSNVGTGGVGVYVGKSGVTLQFRNVDAGSAKITVVEDTTNATIDVDVGTLNFNGDLADVDTSSPSGGDQLRYYGTGGYWENIPGYFHRDSGRPYWDTPGASLKTDSYTASTDDYLIGFYTSSTVTCSLYAASGNYARAILVKNVHPTGTVVVDPSGAELVDNAATLSIPPLQGVLLHCDGSSWNSLLQTAGQYHDASAINAGTVGTARLGSGTANSTTFLRGDQTWATPSGSASNNAYYVPIASGSGNTGVVGALTDQRWHAVCMGKLAASVSAVSVSYYVSAAMAGAVTYAEVGIAKGTPAFDGTIPSLTPVGATDVSTVINSTGSKQTSVSVAGGQSLGSGDWLWIIFGQQASSTNPSISAVNDNRACGVVGYKDSLGSITSNVGSAVSSWTVGTYNVAYGGACVAVVS